MTLKSRHQEPRSDWPSIGIAALTLVTVVVVFLALDDITTDNDRSLAFERFALLCCGAWLFAVSARLMRGGHRVLGAMSIGLLAVAAAAQRDIGPGTRPSLAFAYVATVACLLWFGVLSGILATLGWPSRGRRPV